MLRIIAKTLHETKVSIDLLVLSTYEERLDGTTDLGRLAYFTLARTVHSLTATRRTLYGF